MLKKTSPGSNKMMEEAQCYSFGGLVRSPISGKRLKFQWEAKKKKERERKGERGGEWNEVKEERAERQKGRL